MGRIAAFLRRVLLFYSCLVACSSAQQLVVGDVQGYTGKPVELVCTVVGFDAVSLELTKQLGNISTHSISEFNFTEIRISIQGAVESDAGRYTCAASSSNNLQSMSRGFTLTVTAYQQLQREGPVGQVMTNTENVLRIKCPVSGVPGPSEVFWQKGLSRTAPNVTTTKGEGPFVGSDGYLDLTTSTSEDEDSFRCTAVNIFGDRVTQTFYITIVRQPAVALWRQWYIILVYCVVGSILLVICSLCLWCCCICCCSSGDNKEKGLDSSKRPIQLFTRTTLPEESKIDEYAKEHEESGKQYEEEYEEED